jgi:uncharacterized protein
MIVDAHCHAGTGGNQMTGPWDTAAPLDAYLRRADRAGIERSVLIPVFHSDYRTANREVGGMAARHPDRFWAFCMVHPVQDRGRVGSLVQEAVERFGARGIKVHRHDAPITREVCETARRWGLPVLYDVRGDTSGIELFAPAYRDVTFIIPHLGSFGDDWRAHVSLIDQLVRHPNIYADTSGTRRFDYLVEAVRRAGPGKLIFGTDGPWLHPGVELSKVRLLSLPPSAAALVLGDTIRRLIGEPVGPDRLSHSNRVAIRSTADATSAQLPATAARGA